MAVWNTDVRELDYSSDGCVEYRRQGTRLFKDGCVDTDVRELDYSSDGCVEYRRQGTR